MKVLILGFDNVDEITPVMEKLINESQCYLFNIICGGLGPRPKNPTPAAIWANNNGAPIYWMYGYRSLDELLPALHKETDYLLIKLTNSTPQWIKNFIMKHKQAGKHGTVIR